MGTILDIAIGLALVYVLFSVVCSSLHELVAWAAELRAKTLRDGISALLDDAQGRGLAGAVFKHPTLKSLWPRKLPAASPGSDSQEVPAYVPSHLFVSALFDILRSRLPASPMPAGSPWADLRARVAAMGGAAKPARDALLALLDEPPGASHIKHALELARMLASPEAAEANAALETAVTALPESSEKRAVLHLLTSTPAKAPEAALYLAYRLATTRKAAPLDELRATLASDPWARGALLPQIDESVTDLAHARANIERWFDDSMERVSGAYKRRAQKIIVAITAVVCVACNVDSLQIASSLANDSAQRAALVSAADRVRQVPPSELGQATELAHAAQQLEQTRLAIEDMRLPLGWHERARPPFALSAWFAWLGKLAGILCSMIAISLGAPFWFSTLNKVVNLRASGAPPPRAAR